VSVDAQEFGEFLKEAENITSGRRVCALSLFAPGRDRVEFGDSGMDRVARPLGELGAELSVPDVLLEVPHGATRELDYQALRAQLSPKLPEDLIDYFFVNTDVGSTEVAYRVAEHVAEKRTVLVLRCLVPRTFIDTNRVINRSSVPATNGTSLSNAFPDYIRTETDRTRLLSLYDGYHEIAGRAHALVCENGGLSIAPHTYAPKSISIDSFDEGIGRALRKAYEPELYKTWNIRPEVDFITQSNEVVEGDAEDENSALPEKLAPMRLVEAIWRRYEERDVKCAENESYPLHPASMAHHYSARHPGQVLCLEIRRDLLADPFSPFEQMRISDDKALRMAGPIAESVVDFLAGSDSASLPGT